MKQKDTVLQLYQQEIFKILDQIVKEKVVI